MTQSGSKKPEKEPPADPGSDKRSGRVGFDSRGNSVWEWQVKTGVYTTDVNTESLRKLELNELSLEDTAIRSPEQKAPRVEKAPAKAVPLQIENARAGGGFNPYDNATTAVDSGRNPYDSARAVGERVQHKHAPSAPKKPPTDLRKLSHWIKLKRALLGKKRDGSED